MKAGPPAQAGSASRRSRKVETGSGPLRIRIRPAGEMRSVLLPTLGKRQPPCGMEPSFPVVGRKPFLRYGAVHLGPEAQASKPGETGVFHWTGSESFPQGDDAPASEARKILAETGRPTAIGTRKRPGGRRQAAAGIAQAISRCLALPSEHGESRIPRKTPKVRAAQAQRSFRMAPEAFRRKPGSPSESVRSHRLRPAATMGSPALRHRRARSVSRPAPALWKAAG